MAQEYQICSLDQIAPSYGGNVKNDSIHAQWDAGIETADIDPDMLMEYLVGWEAWHGTPHPQGKQDEGDIGNTALVFSGQIAAFRARGDKALRHAVLNMGALLFTIEAEFNGMKVDKEWALGKAAEIEQEIAELDKELQSFIPKDFPVEFKWTSPIHKSVLIFGGDITYKVRVPQKDEHGNQLYVQKDELHYVLSDGSTMEVGAFNALPPDDTKVLPVFYASGKNAGEAKTKRVKVNNLDKPKVRIEDAVYHFDGYTKPDPKWETSRAGVYTTKSEVIEELGSRDIPFLKSLAKRATMYKDLSTYYIITDPETGGQSGMLTLVGPDGVIHHQIHMVRTITARMSSSDPNLQNVSKGTYDEETGEEKGSQIKRAFISRFRNGVISQSDFTSLEIYVQGILTMCRQLLSDLRDGLDMHALRAEQAWGLKEHRDYAYILEAAKNENHPEHAKWKKMRTRAKVFSFQR